MRATFYILIDGFKGKISIVPPVSQTMVPLTTMLVVGTIPATTIATKVILPIAKEENPL